MQKVKMMLAGVMVLVGTVLMVNPVLAYSCPEGSVRGGGAEVEFASQCNVPEDDDKDGDLMGVLGVIINFLIGITAVIAVFVIIIAGIQMATSQGDAGRVAKARNMIIYGLVGLVIAILAFAIVNFVLRQAFTSASDYNNQNDCQSAGYTWDSKSKTCN